MKNKIVLLILLSACFVFLYSCETKGDIDNSITFNIISISKESREVVINVHNGSESDIYFTRNYSIQMKTYGKWVDIEPPEDTNVLTDILQCPRKNDSTCTLYWPYSISSGNEYRMIMQYVTGEWKNNSTKSNMYFEWTCTEINQ